MPTMAATAVFGGSYGWASAGRFHHAQSQLHRFLNCPRRLRQVGQLLQLRRRAVILPHVLGSHETAGREHVAGNELASDTELVLAFGGLPLKNTSVSGGGTSQHVARDHLLAAHPPRGSSSF